MAIIINYLVRDARSLAECTICTKTVLNKEQQAEFTAQFRVAAARNVDGSNMDVLKELIEGLRTMFEEKDNVAIEGWFKRGEEWAGGAIHRKCQTEALHSEIQTVDLF